MPSGPSGFALGAGETQQVLLVAYQPPPAQYARESQQVLGAPGNAGTTNSGAIVTQQVLMAAFGSGVPNQQRTNAWSFTLDGHTFYVLDLGPQGTYLYDQVTQQWSKWETDGFGTWNMKVGTQYLQSRIVGGDSITGQVWELDPTAVQDEGWRDIQHLATGGLATRNRTHRSVESIRLSASFGLLDEVNGTVMNLRFSDDQEVTWSEYYSVDVSEGASFEEIAWRSMGSFRSPGRVFEISDVGGVIRLDSLDVFIDDFDDEEEGGDPSGGGFSGKGR